MLASNNTMFRHKLPSGFLRTACIGASVLAICTLLVRSSEYMQMMHERESTETMPVHQETGKASWYGPGFQGQETASGEIFDKNKMTAAHPSLPLGSKVEVINLEKDKKVEVTINDRGPYAKGRVIDLSSAAAKKLDMVKKGTTNVKIVTKPVKKKSSKKRSAKKKYTARRPSG
jgi:rare lipoprotein A